MTDEEKQAIEYIDKIVSDCENRWKQLGYTCNLYDGDEPIPVDVYKTVLNLIEKQQRIIEEQKSRYSHLGRDVQKAVDYTFELNKEIEKKDKIIDLMAKYIGELDIDEDICRNKDCDEYTNIYTGGIDCKKCIKEYFKKKVEDK